jgi:hypothetical protein
MPHLPHRDSQAELLLGGDGWAAHKEHGVLFTLDATKCMFSSGNVTERGRMGRLSAAGETVVDLFAGIGYYTLPILVKAGAAKVAPPTQPNPTHLSRGAGNQSRKQNIAYHGMLPHRWHLLHFSTLGAGLEVRKCYPILGQCHLF